MDMFSILIKKIRMIILIILELKKRFSNRIVVVDTESTLDVILNDEISVSRFGDAEFSLIIGENHKYQKCTEEIRGMLKDILANTENNPNCLIAIPYTFYRLSGFTLKSKMFWIKYFAQFRDNIIPYLKWGKYYDAQISRFFINRTNKRRSLYILSLWKKIWQNKKVLIVEGCLSRFGVGNSLLNNAESVQRILCPSVNAFEKIENIYNAVLEVKEEIDLVLLCLGPTATILAYELSKNGIWTIDSGNVDMEYEWLLYGAKTQIPVHNKYTVEAENGTEVGICDDEKYISQIIKNL